MQLLIDLLKDCIVRITLPDEIGAGFFVAPGRILTCAHVAPLQQGARVPVFWQGNEYRAQLEHIIPASYPDLALLHIKEIVEEHPCVFFEEAAHPHDVLFSYGFPSGYRDGSPSDFLCEGFTGGKTPLLTFKGGEVRPGFSGSPVLNLQTGGVCGMIRLTRGEGTLMGGRAIPISTILQHFPMLEEMQHQFHARDRRWSLAHTGDRQYVPQQFYRTHLEPPVDLTAAEESYRQNVVDAYNWLNFSGFDLPDLSLENVSLEDIFVRLALTVEKVIRNPVPSEKWRQDGPRDGHQRLERVVTVQEPVELGQVLSSHSLIVGEPGAGKSTLLRWLAVVFAQRCQRDPNYVGSSADPDRLPLLVEIGHLPDRYLKPEGETPNWLQFLPEHLTAQLVFTNIPRQLLIQALADGRCLLLFDGMDEVADRQARTRLARSLAELARLQSGNRVIIGSRPAGVSESAGALRPQFQICQIKRFTPKDVQDFFHFWYCQDRNLPQQQQREAADVLFARVQAIPAILQLASTPLLAAILILIWRNEGDLPERRVDLYELCCRTLIERWEASHDVFYQGVLSHMGWMEHVQLLAPLAYAIHNREQSTSATREELLPLLAQTLQTVGYATEPTTAIREAKLFLDALGLRSGLLQYMGDDRYGFPHLTFQEYLAARYIADQSDHDYIDLVITHMHEEWWEQVHLLTIAHLGSGKKGASKASTLILKILNAYETPHWLLVSARNRWARLIGPGRLLPWMQFERRIAWILAREFELAAKGYMDCRFDGTGAKIGAALSVRAASLVRHILSDQYRLEEQESLLIIACQLLQRQGDEALISPLLKILHSTHEYVRKKAVTILRKARVDNEMAISSLLKALHNNNGDVRIAAARSLGEVGVDDEVVINSLLKALHDTDKGVRWEAAESLGEVGVGNEVVISSLLEALHDTDWDIRRRALVILGKVGVGNEALILPLLEALHDTNSDVRWCAATSLGEVGVSNEVVINSLLEALHDVGELVRSAAATSLGKVGVGNEALIPPLLEALHDTNWKVRNEAATSLGEVGVSNEVVINSLLEALHDVGELVRSAAATSLGKVGVSNEVVINSLLEALHDVGELVRGRAAADLGKVGISNEVVISPLLEALHDVDGLVRRMAAISLGEVGVSNEMVINSLLEALHDVDGLVRSVAATSLGKVGVSNEVVISSLLEALRDVDRPVRSAAATSLGKVGVGNEVLISPLLEALHDVDEFVRRMAAISLGEVGVGNEALIPLLLEALHDTNSDVRWCAAEVLGKVGTNNKMAISSLMEALHDARESVRYRAATSLGELEIKNTIQLRRVLIALNSCLHNQSFYVRQAALRSIRQLLDARPIPY